MIFQLLCLLLNECLPTKIKFTHFHDVTLEPMHQGRFKKYHIEKKKTKLHDHNTKKKKNYTEISKII